MTILELKADFNKGRHVLFDRYSQEPQQSTKYYKLSPVICRSGVWPLYRSIKTSNIEHFKQIISLHTQLLPLLFTYGMDFAFYFIYPSAILPSQLYSIYFN